MFKNQQENLFEQWKGRTFFETKYFFNFLLEVSKDWKQELKWQLEQIIGM